MLLEVVNDKDGWLNCKTSRKTGLKKSLFAIKKRQHEDEDSLIGGNDGGIKELIIEALRTCFLPVIIVKFGVE